LRLHGKEEQQAQNREKKKRRRRRRRIAMREEEEEEKGAGDSCFEESNTMATWDAIVATDTVEINPKSLSGLLSIPLCV
jgi:hypothetical protein